ncbi:MAG: hypothetical protein HC925_01750 [Coleofasciculaceae cyanobacterium SM2_3_26]|nr:hypothetical protein [Coleofasciculaceae cyanobacterium SM2_3_26]
MRELSLAVGASVMTRWELHQAAAHLPLTLLADESFLAYEQTHNPQWSPTSWLVDWAKGQWVLPGIVQPPLIELRWLLFQRQ